MASSSLVFRSKQRIPSYDGIFFGSLGGGTGRHAGLKILSSATEVRVRFPPEAHLKALIALAFKAFFILILSHYISLFSLGVRIWCAEISILWNPNRLK